MKKVKFSKLSLSDKLLLLAGYLLLGLFVIAIIIPIIYIVIASFMDPITLQNSGISFDLDISILAEDTNVLEVWVVSYDQCTAAMRDNFNEVLKTIRFSKT